MTTTAAYTRPRPPEWDRLHEVAGIVTGLQDPAWDNPVLLTELGHEIDPLSLLAHMNNRFYAYGHVVCGFARDISDDETRQGIVTSGAQELVRVSELARSGGISALNNGFDLANPFKESLDNAYCDSPKPIQLISNYLDTAFNQGVNSIVGRRATSLEITEAVAAQMRGDRMPNARVALDSITVAAQYIINETLLSRGVNTKEGQLPDQDQIDKLRDESLIRTAKKLCTVTPEQSLGHEGRVIKVDDTTIDFIRPENTYPTVFTQIARGNQDSLLIGEVKHTPMVCPALHVQSVIPQVMEMTVDMLDEARQMLKVA